MEGSIEAIGGGLVESFEEMSVGVESGPDRRVSEAVLDHFRVFALGNQQGNVGVSQVMEPTGLSY